MKGRRPPPCKYIDKSGTIVLDLAKVRDLFDVFSDVVESFSFHEGVVRAYDRMGFIDKARRWVIIPEGWRYNDSREGMARVFREGKEHYIHHEGKFEKNLVKRKLVSII